jgi:hypothetical protein
MNCEGRAVTRRVLVFEDVEDRILYVGYRRSVHLEKKE